MTDCFVGIDTSNYTTSAAVCTAEGQILANLKMPLPVREGECGLRQSDAVFAHTKNLPAIMQKLAEPLHDARILAVGCSARPRPAADSYMPCFLTGVAAAQSLATGAGVPLFSFSHQEGHLMAAAFSSGAPESLLQAPFAAFHVSGGTTDVLLAKPDGSGFSVERIAGTEDLNAGQAIDRAGVMMGLPFPCGAAMERLAEAYQGKISSPRICVRDGNCHLSGLQNQTEKLWRETADPGAVSAYVFAFLGKTLAAMTAALDADRGELPVVYAGGVMSNRSLQKYLGTRKNTWFAEPMFSADNAAGIALLCRRKYLEQSNYSTGAAGQ